MHSLKNCARTREPRAYSCVRAVCIGGFSKCAQQTAQNHKSRATRATNERRTDRPIRREITNELIDSYRGIEARLGNTFLREYIYIAQSRTKTRF